MKFTSICYSVWISFSFSTFSCICHFETNFKCGRSKTIAFWPRFPTKSFACRDTSCDQQRCSWLWRAHFWLNLNIFSLIGRPPCLQKCGCLCICRLYYWSILVSCSEIIPHWLCIRLLYFNLLNAHICHVQLFYCAPEDSYFLIFYRAHFIQKNPLQLRLMRINWLENSWYISIFHALTW